MRIILICVLALILIYFLFFQTSLILMFLDVSGRSMIPTFKGGERLISVRRYLTRIKVGDIIVAKPNYYSDNRLVIKRVSRVHYSNYLQSMTYYVLGDNPDESCDSRNYGWLSEKEIVAKVLMRKSK